MTTPKQALELKPCPFCGRTNTHAADTGAHWVACNSCDAEGPIRDTEHEAIIAWNTRATASLQGEDAVERVARMVDPQAWRDRDYYDDYRRLPASEHPATKSSITKARAILATGLAPDEDAVRADSTANLITIIADIREKTGLGGKPMLNELADAIVAEMDRRVADEREKMLDKVCENLIVLSRGDESIIGAARVALNNAAVFICGADRAKRAIRSGGGE